MNAKARLLFTLFCQLQFQIHAQIPTTPYGRTTHDDMKQVMDRVLVYADQATPVGIINKTTGAKITDLKKPVLEATLTKSEFGIATHEWGLAYMGMLPSLVFLSMCEALIF